MNWQQLKLDYSNKLANIYSANEADQLIQILGEELLPHYNKLQFKDLNFSIKNEEVNLIIEALKRLQNNEPYQYILKKAWFYDLELKVNPHVLIPRPETEELVDLIIKENPNFDGALLDIGTGSGCIPLTLKKHLTQAEVYAIDVDKNVVELAKENAQNLNLNVSFKLVNILEENESESLSKFNIIVSNPPYILEEEKKLMHKNVLDFEPHLALFVENDNALLFYKTIAHFAVKHLQSKGKLYFECNEFNAKDVAAMLCNLNFINVEICKDLQGKDRMIKAALN